MKRFKHSLSNFKLFTCDMGWLIPINWFEALPGDSVRQQTMAVMRCAPLLSPVMHPVVVRIHHWFVPLRLIWEDFESFITGGPDGTDSSVPPYRAVASNTESSMLDYLGVPVATFGQTMNLSMLPARAYDLIYNTNYRDQDLIDEVDLVKTSGEDNTSYLGLARVAWEKDYFTTARPWETKGDTVTVPLGTTAPVISAGDGVPTFNAGGGAERYLIGNTAYQYPLYDASPSTTGPTSWNQTRLQADLSSAEGVEINDLRLALALQRYQEARANYGSRYSEYLRYLGVRSSDARLQDPEYLGGGRQAIQFNDVVQTAEGTNPVGTLRGRGMSAMRSNRYIRYFEEHGIVMTLMSVLPKAIYSQTLHRSWTRQTKEDYFQKELQHIGEQEIPNYEAYIAHSSPTDTFGFQARYDEYRSIPSTIAGEFRSTLNHWHYSRIHTGDIALNQSFIEANPTKRVNAAPGSHCLYVTAHHSIQARRMLTSRAYNKTF